MTYEWTDNQGLVKAPNPNAQTGLVSGGKFTRPRSTAWCRWSSNRAELATAM